MASSSFEELLKDRSDYIRIARKNGFEEGLRNLLSELYPDNAHFIYELLQNAEDARATTIEFSLRFDRLVVTHDGARQFSLDDVESITSIGQSTKKDDETSIGKFGVGFKAVFAYTARPEVRSGTFTFVIEDLLVPKLTNGSVPEGRTSFTFPFDRPEKTPEIAVTEVKRGLEDLGEKTLLFLSHISTISYSLPDGTEAIIVREEHDDLIITVKKQVGRTITESKWLRLVGASTIGHDVREPLKVAAAFQLKEVEPKSTGKDRREKRDNVLSVVPVDLGEVCIYFPAVKEHSGLRFHIHAPFASTVARDSVRDHPDNAQLVTDIGRLIVDSLPAMRDTRLITDSLLATLPNEKDPLQKPYTSIRDVVIEAFNTESFTPVRGGNGAYAPAKSLISSPSEFRNFLDESDLKTLLFINDGTVRDANPRWIRDSTGRAAKFLEGLSPEVFGWEELGSTLQWVQPEPGTRYIKDGVRETPSDEDREAWSSWLADKSDKAMENLYRLLGRGKADYNLISVKFDQIPLIRIKQCGKVKHVTGPTTYLPSSRSDQVSTLVPHEFAYFDDEDNQRAQDLRSFFRAAGVERWSESTKIESRLAPYKRPSYARAIPTSDADIQAHLADVRAFVEYAKGHAHEAETKFKDVAFLLAPNPEAGSNALMWVSPADTFLDEPFEDTGFGALYKWEFVSWDDEEDPDYGLWVEPKKHCPADIYADIAGFAGFLKQVGTTYLFTVLTTRHHGNQQFQPQWRPARTSYYTIDDDYQLDLSDLNSVAETANMSLLRTLWESLVSVPGTKAVAQYRGNNSSNTFRFESKLAQELKSVPWVLTREGNLLLPKDALADDLPDDWSRPSANSLLTKIGFGTREKVAREQREQLHADLVAHSGSEHLATAVLDAINSGVPPEVLIEAAEEYRLQRAAFPEAASESPSRRAEIASGDAASAPIRETEEKMRQVVRGQSQSADETRTYLRENYTDSDQQMICQSCQDAMPFKLKDGSWYFEAVQFVPGRKRIHKANALALCPVCAAKYQYVRDTKDHTLIDDLLAISVRAGEGSIELPVLIAGKRVALRFTGKHAIDLQAALRVAGEGRY